MKICPKCKEEKPFTDFYGDCCSSSGLRAECKKCTCADSSRRHASLKARVDKIKLETGCVKCGYIKCAAALEWHHKNADDKLYKVSEMVSQRAPWPRIEAEMDKCIIICANCHRELHNGG